MDEENRAAELAEENGAELDAELDKDVEIEITAPIMPWEIVLRQSVTYFQKKPNGGMQVKFCPAVGSPSGGARPMPPAFVLDFGADGWKFFQETVAADGVVAEAPPKIETAQIIPPGVFRPPGV